MLPPVRSIMSKVVPDDMQGEWTIATLDIY